MASRQTTRVVAGHALAVVGAVLLASCTSGNRSAVEGLEVFNEVVALERGDKVDSARREFAVDADATFVVMADEDDNSITVTLSHSGAAGTAPVADESGAVPGEPPHAADDDRPSRLN